MILGFAHITKNVPIKIKPVVGTLLNPPEKWPLMVCRPTHYAMSFNASPGVMCEFVEYNTDVVERPGRLGLLTEYISLCVRDYRPEVKLLCDGLGFVTESNRLRLVSQVKVWQVSAVCWVDPDAPIDPPLDIAGYAALAFYSSDVEADRDHLLKHGGRTPTEPFTVKLDREMKIVMLRSPEGTIIELIQVLK